MPLYSRVYHLATDLCIASATIYRYSWSAENSTSIAIDNKSGAFSCPPHDALLRHDAR